MMYTRITTFKISTLILPHPLSGHKDCVLQSPKLLIYTIVNLLRIITNYHVNLLRDCGFVILD